MRDLKSLRIDGFRGAITPFTLRFNKGSTVTVICGENASGKSTICDAMEFLARGKVGSLDDRGLGTTLRYWPSLGRTPADVSVALETDGGSCHATLARTGDVQVHPPEARPAVEIFRRNQILSLIEAKPSERYAAISRFIDVSGIEVSEGSLRDLIRDLKKQRDGASARLEENEATIVQFWETEGKAAPDAFTWAESECLRSQGDVEAEITAIRALQAAYERLRDIPGRLKAGQQTLVAAKQAAESATATMQTQIQGISKDAAQVVGLLEAANAFFDKVKGAPACPLCESTEKSAQLAGRIKERLRAFSALQSARTQLDASTAAVERADQQLQVVRESARQDVLRFESCLSDRALPPDIAAPEASVPNSASGLAAWLNASKDLYETWRKAEASRLDRKQFLNTLRQAMGMWQVNRAAKDDLDALLPRLEDALRIVEDERRRFTDDVLSAISGEVSRLYEMVHPAEGMHRIHLELDPKKRASLEIGAEFCGRQARPQGYFSESHLDTLGLCVFLALSALDQPERTIVILDDVLSSVDDAHALRILNLLESESARFRHVIVTTHSQLLRNPSAREYQFIELGPWSPTAGLTLQL
jgi:energy-coupling factor transporter ATP-binding protein EcfA2